MLNNSFARYLLSLLIAFSVLAPVSAQSQTRVATVLFVSGGAIAEAGGVRQLKVGDGVFEGDLLVTGPDGHLYLRTVDQGFFSLRPETRAQIQAYRFDSARPEATQIRLALQSGVMRAVSGKGAQAARDKYRLETPVAAIGLRGTDYTVFTTAETTRVSVHSGAVIVGSLGAGGCAAGGMGPCTSGGAVELSGMQREKMIEVVSAATPRLLEAPVLSPLRPERISPPLPNEKRLADEALIGKTAAGRDEALATGRETRLQETLREGAEIVALAAGPLVTDKPALELPAPALEPPRPVLEPPKPAPEAPWVSTLRWGRWADLSGPPSPSRVAQILGPNAAMIALNDRFVLGREGVPQLPGSGTLSFRMEGAEAYVTSLAGKVSAAGLENGYLNVDLGTKRFNTGFDVTHGKDRYAMSIPGLVSSEGRLIGDIGALTKGTVLNGVIGTDGREAAYIFSGRLGGAGTVTGATYWVR